MEGFDLADLYRTPVMILGDGMIGQMMEPVEFRYQPRADLPEKDWATRGKGKGKQRNVINSLYLQAEELEKHNHKLQAKYAKIRENEKKVEEYNVEGADLVITAYGTTSRIAKTAIAKLEKEGYKVGMIRPISLYPFPNEAYEKIGDDCKGVLTVEMSTGQMIDDVKISLQGRIPTYFHGRSGGMVPEPEEIVEKVKEILGGDK
jgi:2-oxoglutarate ferredoxin oxidoreductase subunit alpha